MDELELYDMIKYLSK